VADAEHEGAHRERHERFEPMSKRPTTFEIDGPVVVVPLDEYMRQQADLEDYRRLKAIYDTDRKARFAAVLSIAERNRDIPPGQVEVDVADAVKAARRKP
jgi:hypothetical protein